MECSFCLGTKGTMVQSPITGQAICVKCISLFKKEKDDALFKPSEVERVD